MADRADADARTWPLVVGVALAAAEMVVTLVALVRWSDRHAPLLLLALATKFLFCWGAARRRPGALLGLLLWELTTAIALSGASGLDAPVRVAGCLTALLTLALLLASTRLFPSPTLPPRYE